MGPILKVVLRFSAPFWSQLENGRYRQATFFFRHSGSFPTFWTCRPLDDPLLVAWQGGPLAERLSRLTDREIVAEALDGLQRLFGDSVPVRTLLSQSWVHNWQRDPFSLGAYSYVGVGGLDARRLLAQPLEGTLFFAGEATDHAGEGSTVAGALASGERAAKEVLKPGR
jgi:monoamine oxidase